MLKSLYREWRRSAAVQGLGLPETPAASGFDQIVTMAASGFGAPMALLSLIHGDRQWFKACHGLSVTCIARSQGFCSFALDRDDVLECCDPMQDSRFAALPVVVGAPFVRYYIGAPLRCLSGVDVGALCVVDTIERPPASPDQKALLRGLARQATLAMEARLDMAGGVI